MELKPGYKQSEVGVIPNEWEVVDLGKHAEVTKLAGFEYTKHFKSYMEGGDVIVVRGTNITHNSLDLSDIRTIPRSTSDKLPRSKLKSGDLVFAYVGTIGPIFLVDEDHKYHLGPNTARITCRHPSSPRFLFCYFSSDLIRKEIVEKTSTGAQPSLSMTKIRSFRVAFPPTRAEQEAIAETLSDADAVIQSLEKLIAKKRQIKQGAMQELLTGKTRLPGFSGAWETLPFDGVLLRLNVKAHQIRATEYQEHGEYPIVDQGKEPIAGFSDLCERRLRCPSGGVILFGDHTCIVKFIDFDCLVGADGTQVLEAKPGQCARFHALQLQHRGVESTGYNRHFKLLRERDYLAPPLAEQAAIAAVLSDMDAEIAALESKLAKVHQIKQGMMQELLTGRTRLV